MTVIDPNNLDQKPRHRTILRDLLLQADRDQTGWGEQYWYEVEYKLKRMNVGVTNTIIKRQSKKGGFRYDVIDHNALGAGGYGTVYPVIITYKIVDNKLIAKHKPPGKRRIAKLIKHNNDEKILEKALVEYKVSSMTPHLSPKFPAIFDSSIFLISKRIEGQELFNIIKSDRTQIKELTLEQRFQLSLGLIRALQEQVFDPGLIHRDLKPENIILDLESGSIGIIDFGLAKIGEKQNKGDCSGSAPYAPPETFMNEGRTKESDVYSLGRILALIWRNDLGSYQAGISVKSRLLLAEENDYSNLFRGIQGLDPKVKSKIRHLLITMTAYHREERATLNEAFKQFSAARQLQFSPPPAPVKEKELKKESSSSTQALSTTQPLSRRHKKDKIIRKEPNKIEEIKTPKTAKKWNFFNFKNKYKKLTEPKASSKRTKGKGIITQQQNEENKNLDFP